VRDVVERVKIPQADFFGFGEKLAVVEQGVSDPTGMGFIFDKIAAFLASDFKDISALVGQHVSTPTHAEAAGASKVPKPREASNYSYDIFISHDASTMDFVIEFRDALKQELTLQYDREITIFLDVREIRTGTSWADHVSEALAQSKVLLAIVTPLYLTSKFPQSEFAAFKERSRQTGRSLLLPVLLRGETSPDLAEFQLFDLRKFPILKSSPSRWPVALKHQMTQLAERLKEMIDQAPPHDPHWSASAKEEGAGSIDVTGPKFGELEPDATKFRVQHQPDSTTYKLLSQKPSLIRPLPLPQSRGGLEPILLLSDTYGSNGADVVKTIQQEGRIAFHAVGSTGNVRGPREMALVADKMTQEFYEDSVMPKASFLFHLGDVIYSFGEAKYYYDQFYVPYRHYPRPILAIPGNHDGMVVPKSGGTSLQAFLANFCAPDFRHMPEAGGLRTAQIQPGVYFTLDAPFVRILALYSNVLEGPGVISSEGGKFSTISDVQLQFLEAALRRIKQEAFQGAVIVAVHHDPFSPTGGRNREMVNDLDSVSKKTGVWPHAILSAHAHNYQRYTRMIDGRLIAYVVAGNGGHGISHLQRGISQGVKIPVGADGALTLEAFDDQGFGYVRVTADSSTLRIDYQPATATSPADSITIDLRASLPSRPHHPVKSRAGAQHTPKKRKQKR
jgi:hypothetical protein